MFIIRQFLLLTIFFSLQTVLAQEKQTFSIDRIHSKIGFSVGYAGGVIEADGRFENFSGSLTLNPENISDFTTRITINVASINTGMEFRDKDLRSANWFDAESFPTITFNSSSIHKSGNDFFLKGTLNMRGVSNTVQIKFRPTVEEITQGPMRQYAGYTGSFTVNRKDYGIHLEDPEKSFWKYNDVMASTGQMFVADSVRIELKILAVRRGREILADAVSNAGIEKGYEIYLGEKSTKGAAVLFHEQDLNALGYQLLAEKRLADALTIFQYYTRDFPESSNAYDSLGEAYMIAGKKDLAIENFQKSLQLNPRNSNAKKMIEKLQNTAGSNPASGNQ